MQNHEQLRLNLGGFEEKIGYVFKDKKNIITALTHSSYAYENKADRLECNERLEFLGDAVLSLAVSERVFKKRKDLAEGEMTKLRANIVCEPSLEVFAAEIGIGEYLLLGRGEERTGGRTRSSILADAFEAVIGAIYIDSGMENAKKFIYAHMQSFIDGSAHGSAFSDYKTQLQEIIQKSSDARITYEIVEEKGPDHNKVFVAMVRISEREAGLGEGRNKKEAEQNAARKALASIGRKK